MYYLHLYGRTSTEQETSVQQVARLMFGSKDGGVTFLRNVGSHTVYTAQFPEDGDFKGKCVPENVASIARI
jgi:hypothetical protein